MQLTKTEYSWAQWRSSEEMIDSKSIRCDRCDKNATHLAVAEEKTSFDPDEVIIKKLCDEHWNKNTQKAWIKNWRKKNICI